MCVCAEIRIASLALLLLSLYLSLYLSLSLTSPAAALFNAVWHSLEWEALLRFRMIPKSLPSQSTEFTATLFHCIVEEKVKGNSTDPKEKSESVVSTYLTLPYLPLLTLPYLTLPTLPYLTLPYLILPHTYIHT